MLFSRFLVAYFAIMSTTTLAADLGIPFDKAGELASEASSHMGENIDWGHPICGPPRYFDGVCVWKLGNKFSLTTNRLSKEGNTTLLTLRWIKPDRAASSEAKIFSLGCRALVRALRPQWPVIKIKKFVEDLHGKMHRDHELKTEGIIFAFYTYPETLTCEAQPDE